MIDTGNLPACAECGRVCVGCVTCGEEIVELKHERDEARTLYRTERELRKKAEDRLHDLVTGTQAEAVQGEAAWRERALVCEKALAALQEENDTHAALRDALAQVGKAEATRDEAQSFYEGQADRCEDLQDVLYKVKRERDEARARVKELSTEVVVARGTYRGEAAL